MTTMIEQAARREQAAERNRAQAEAAWRQAWWQTTLTLGEVAESDRAEVTAVLDTAQAILGQSRGWLSNRRMTGRLFATLPPGFVHQLPPRLAVAYCQSHGDPSQAVTALRDAEARGLSLRDFAAELGTQPKSWLREGEQHQRPVTVEQLRAQPAAAQAALIRQALDDPAVASRVFTAPRPALPASPPSSFPSAPALDDGPHPHRPAAQPVPDPGLPDVLHLLGDARTGIEQAFRLSVLKGLVGDEQVLAALSAVEAEAGFLRKYLTGAAVDEAITQIMSDGAGAGQ
jgi:hypothetical protein